MLEHGNYTIFTTCRPFVGEFAKAQIPALKSWGVLNPRPEVLLIGDDEGSDEVARKFKFRHIPEVARNQSGTPLMRDVFAQAEANTENEYLVYCNADVILTQSLADGLEVTVDNLQYHRKPFLLIGVRWQLNNAVFESDFKPGWEDDLLALLATNGRQSKPIGLDYFAYKRGALGKPRNWPKFALGRSYWDSWLVWYARLRRMPIVDATQAILCVHNYHTSVDKAAEQGYNRKWTEKRTRLGYVWDAEYKLTPEFKLVPAKGAMELWSKEMDWHWKTFDWTEKDAS